MNADILKAISDSKRTLFILCGYPYSGKSYLAQEIISKASVEYVSIDEIFASKGFDWDSNALPDASGWEEIFRESYDLVRAALKSGRSVLYDSTNQTFASREKLRELAREAGAEARVIYVKVPQEAVWKRWEENRRERKRSVVARELVQSTLDSFEEPRPEENVLVL